MRKSKQTQLKVLFNQRMGEKTHKEQCDYDLFSHVDLSDTQ